MSIVKAIDEAKASVEQEITELENKLDQSRGRLENIDALRVQALEVEDAEGGGLPDTATPPKAKPAAPRKPKGARKPKASVSDPGTPFHEQVLDHVRQHPGCSGMDIVQALGVEGNSAQSKVSYALKQLGPKVRSTRIGKSKSWEVADRPNPAPARNGRAAPAPATKPEPRPLIELAPTKQPSNLPPSPAAEAHNALREKVAQAIVELVADSEPITGDEITTMVLEQVPEAEREDVTVVRTRLCRAPECKLEQRADGFHLAGRTSTGRTVTNAEREAVGCLGTGRTAREVAANCDSIRDATSARAILEGLVRRKVVRRRPDSEPPVYECLEAGVSV